MSDVYSQAVMAKYHSKPLKANTPHIFAIADVTYRAMVRDKKNQSLLISGETGAGKTEATKYLMRYLTQITGEGGKVEKTLLQAHPILESFGNGKTRQNDNSSRFGKFFQIYFGTTGGMTGAIINHYLLEKSRVVYQAEGERNYHIFYELLAGATEEEKGLYSLNDASHFFYLSQSGCTNRDGMNEAKQFLDVKNALSSFNISMEDRTHLFGLLAAILHIGNLNFQKDTKRNEAAMIGNKNVLSIIAKLLDCAPNDLETALCSRNMSVKAQAEYIIPLKVDEAISNRDALAKSIYGKLFDWLINKINQSLQPTSTNQFIGILDIFGFETFENNSFEQFCINYSNEQLQQFFSKHLFKVEQEEYIKEKIQWSKVEFEDNQGVIDLIEKKPLGILSILDEECSFPKGNDSTFLEKLDKMFGSSAHFKKPLRTQGIFVINHYAAEVCYDVNGFLTKNKDNVNADLLIALQNSKQEFIKQLFPKNAEEPNQPVINKPAVGPSPVQSRFGQPAVKAAVNMGPPKATVKRTIGTQFKEQLKSLMAVLSTTEPHFIRAVKPNNSKTAHQFDGVNVLRQLSYAGLLETIRIRAAGYSYRPTFEEFVSRFQMLQTSGKNHKTPKDKCVSLLTEHNIEEHLYQLGSTKLFLKDREYNNLMELREEVMHKAAAVIQNKWKNWNNRQKYIRQRSCAIALQTAIRGYSAKRELRIKKRDKEKAERELRLQKEKEELLQRKAQEEKERQEKLQKAREEEEKRRKEEAERREREEQERIEKARRDREAREQAERERRAEALRIQQEREEEMRLQLEKEDEKRRQEIEARRKREAEEEELRRLQEEEEMRKLREEEERLEREHSENLRIQKQQEREEEQRRIEEEKVQEEERRKHEEEEIKKLQEESERSAYEAAATQEAEAGYADANSQVYENGNGATYEESYEENEWADAPEGNDDSVSIPPPIPSSIPPPIVPQDFPTYSEDSQPSPDESNLPTEQGEIEGEGGARTVEEVDDVMPAFFVEPPPSYFDLPPLPQDSASRFSTISGVKRLVPSASVVRVTFNVELEYKKLLFNSIGKAPLLRIPEGSTFTKYDYSLAKTEPFSFNLEPEVEIDERHPPAINVGEDPITMDEPEVGLQPESVDLKALDRMRSELPFIKFCPLYHRFEDEEKKEETATEVTSSDQLRKTSPEDVTAISITEPINKKDLKDFIKRASNCTKCESLILTQSGIGSSIADLSLPNLRDCDLSNNSFSKLTPILKCLKKSPNLEEITLAKNPVNDKPATIEKLLVAFPFLKRYNGREIRIEERMQAILQRGSRTQKKDADLLRWDLTFSTLPVLNEMKTWQPELITQLLFPKCKLNSFHIGTLVSLQELDLSGNFISSLLGSGIEQCTSLVRANFSNNRIVKKSDLRVFEFTPSLLYLHMQGNEDPEAFKTLSSEYKSLILYITRNLKGTNRCPGLIELDGSPISTEERIAAVEKHCKKKREGVLHRWNLSLIDYYGHHQMRSPNYLTEIRHCQLKNCGLSTIDLRGMYSLEMLDLSGNNFEYISGLKELLRLKFLNLSGNLPLDIDKTLQDLKDHQNFQQVSFGILQNEFHNLYVDNKKYREKVLVSLLPKNRYLKWIDNRRITLDERINTLRLMPSSTKKDVENYRFELALVNNCIEPWERDFHFSATAIGIQYDACNIISLNRMNSFKLKSSACNFTGFVALEELNLSNNKLTDFTVLGLEKLPHLKVLDVSNNRISTSLQDIASYLDTLKPLECIALRGNPSMKTDSDRKKLIGLMKSMREITCVLQVIDTMVTIDERIEAWRANGGTKEESEMLRYRAVMFQRMPRDLDPLQLTTLDLSDAGFKKIDVSSFANLEILLLRGNLLKELDSTGIISLKKLNVLNLQNNRLPKMEAITELVRKLPRLQTVGISGNKCTESKDYRHKFLCLVPELHEKRMALKMLDEDAITVDEIVEAWKATKRGNEDSRHFRFTVLMLTKIPSSDASMVQELDFSACGLSHVDISNYSSLVKFSLAGNQIKSIKESRFGNMNKLRGLDISKNKIKDLEPLCVALSEMSALQVLFLDDNPCFPDNDATNRINFLTQMFSYVDPKKFPLLYLNGQKVTVHEKCYALTKAKTTLSKEAIESIRLDLALGDLNVSPGDTHLDLSNFEFSSIVGLNIRLPHITHLNLSNNKLRFLEPQVLKGLPNLSHLDISHNTLTCLKDITDVLSKCTSLESVVLINSTNSKESAIPREYAFTLFKVLPLLLTIDGLKNPFGTVVKRKKPEYNPPAIMSLADTMQTTKTPTTEESQSSLSTEFFDTSLTSIYNKNPNLTSRAKDTIWNRQQIYRPRGESIFVKPADLQLQ